MMKKLLTVGLLLASTPSSATDAPKEPGCHLQIGNEWITIGVSSMDSCLKYAESAASAGERQIVRFNGRALSYQDGRYFSSADDGLTWSQFWPYAAAGQIRTLNVLRAPDESLRKPLANRGGELAAQRPSGTDPRAPTATPAQAPATPRKPVPAPVSPVATPVATAAGRVDSAQPTAHNAAPVQAVAAPDYTDSAWEGHSHDGGCRMNIDQQWKIVVAPSLEACGKLLILNSKIDTAGAEAYWRGNYLYYSDHQLQQSQDGHSWAPMLLR